MTRPRYTGPDRVPRYVKDWLVLAPVVLVVVVVVWVVKRVFT